MKRVIPNGKLEIFIGLKHFLTLRALQAPCSALAVGSIIT